MKSDVLIIPWTSVIGLPHRAQRLPRLPNNLLSIPTAISFLRSHCRTPCRSAAAEGRPLIGLLGDQSSTSMVPTLRELNLPERESNILGEKGLRLNLT